MNLRIEAEVKSLQDLVRIQSATSQPQSELFVFDPLTAALNIPNSNHTANICFFDLTPGNDRVSRARVMDGPTFSDQSALRDGVRADSHKSKGVFR